MATSDAKSDLRDYLQGGREAMLWKLEGLSEYDARRPLTPTGTNLLGLVKHLAVWEFRYFGDVFGRPRCRRGPMRPACGRPPTSHVSTSPGGTAGPGHTPTRPSTR